MIKIDAITTLPQLENERKNTQFHRHSAILLLSIRNNQSTI